MRIYIAGPITGQPDNNRPAFESAATQLFAAGHQPVNPLDYTEAQWPWDRCMRVTVGQMLTCDGVALLEGYQSSLGALAEYETAERFNMEVKELEGWL